MPENIVFAGDKKGGAVFATTTTTKSRLVCLLFCRDGAGCNLIEPGAPRSRIPSHVIPIAGSHQDSVFGVRESSGVVCFNSAGNPRRCPFSIPWWHTWSRVFLSGSAFLVCQRGPSLSPNKACVLYASGGSYSFVWKHEFWCQNEGFLVLMLLLCISWYINGE